MLTITSMLVITTSFGALIDSCEDENLCNIILYNHTVRKHGLNGISSWNLNHGRLLAMRLSSEEHKVNVN